MVEIHKLKLEVFKRQLQMNASVGRGMHVKRAIRPNKKKIMRLGQTDLPNFYSYEAMDIYIVLSFVDIQVYNFHKYR